MSDRQGNPIAGARLALGGVRSTAQPPFRCDSLPAGGPKRDAALQRIVMVLAADLERWLGQAVASGWSPLDGDEIAAGWQRVFDVVLGEAVEDGLFQYRHAFPADECPACGAEFSAGRCWGCGAL